MNTLVPEWSEVAVHVARATSEYDREAELVELGRRLRAARRAKRLTQVELARLAGINRVNLANVERGTAEIGVIRLRRIAGALDVTVGELVD